MGILQDKMKALLERVGLPYKNINVYGQQIVITCASEDTCRKWATTLSPKVAKFKGITESMEYTKKNKGTVLRPTRTRVYRAFFRL